MSPLTPGSISVRGVSRSFVLLADRNRTLKETVLRRGRGTGKRELEALKDVDLEVAPGEAVGLIGQNGSGKSTLLKVIAGIIPPDRGTVEVGGQVASMLELGAGFHPDFTGRENVYMNGAIHGLSEREVDRRMDDIITFAEIARFIDQPVRTYSSGMQMRLAFSIASHVEPDVMLLDEVLAVGDEAFQRKCFGRVFEYKRRGGTIIFVSHDAGIVERICDRAVLIHHGEVVVDAEVHEAVTRYHRLLAGEPDPEPDSGDVPEPTGADDPILTDPRVRGTKTALIRAVRLIGPDGPTRRVLSGQPITVEVDVDPLGEVIDVANVGVRVDSVDGAVCFGRNTLALAVPHPIREPTRVRMHLPELHLHEGQFTIGVGLASQDERTLYHWLERWLEFTVFQNGPGFGMVTADPEWSFEPLSTAARAAGGAATA